MTDVYSLEQIKSALDFKELLREIERGFVLYSEGRTIVPPVGHLGFQNPPADVHIKYGYIKDDDFYVVKIASGFYENPKIGLPSSNGLMLVFSRRNGELKAVLLDEGYLTDVRTAIAGAVAAKYLAPKGLNRIGIVGTGVQARLQLELLKEVTDCRAVVVWGRRPENLARYREEMAARGFAVETTRDISLVAEKCRLIVTTTPADAPLIFAAQIKKGTHITAVGADAPGKQELDARIFGLADVIVADSLEQAVGHGELAGVRKNGVVPKTTVWELGKVISRPDRGRTNDEQISVADLTGVAVQDIQIAKYVYQKLK